MDRETALKNAMNSSYVKNVIEEQAGNWTGEHGNPPEHALNAFHAYAAVAAMRVIDQAPPPPQFGLEWKKGVVNNVRHYLDIDALMQEQWSTIIAALGPTFKDHELSGLYKHSLWKVAQVSACAAYMTANELNPEILRMTDDEAAKSLAEFATQLEQRYPEKVLIVILDEASAKEVADPVLQRIGKPDLKN